MYNSQIIFHPSTKRSLFIFGKSPRTYVNMAELKLVISRHVYFLISTIVNEVLAVCILGRYCLAYNHRRKNTCAKYVPQNELVFRDWEKSECRTKIDLASQERGIHDTGNLWHAISHRMKTWCRHVDRSGAMQTFRLFHRVLHGSHTVFCTLVVWRIRGICYRIRDLILSRHRRIDRSYIHHTPAVLAFHSPTEIIIYEMTVSN